MQGETVFVSEFSMGYIIPGWSGGTAFPKGYTIH